MSESAEPVFFDTLFHRKRKHGKWDTVDAPQLEGLVADTHAHLQLLNDVYEDGPVTYDRLDAWRHEAAVDVARLVHRC